MPKQKSRSVKNPCGWPWNPWPPLEEDHLLFTLGERSIRTEILFVGGHGIGPCASSLSVKRSTNELATQNFF